MDVTRTSSVCSLLLAVACSSGQPVHVTPGTAGTGATGAAETNGAAGDTGAGTAGGGPAGSTAQGGSVGSTTGDAGSAGGSTASGSGGNTDTGAGGSGVDAGQTTSGNGGSTGAAGTSGGPDGGGAVSGFAVGDFSKAMPIGDQTLPRKLYILNSCSYDIWTFGLPNGTLKIAAGDLQVVGWSNKFSGRVWPRSECIGTGNNPKCAQTGNDTLAEFTLNEGKKSDWYDISLVDGFTIPLSIIQLDAPWTADPSYVPGGKLGADGQCGSPVCAVDLDKNCPPSQQKKDSMGNVVECVNGQSSNGGHGSTPVTAYMKMGCPTSYTYPFDDPQSLFTCPCVEQNGGVGAKDYEIVYCPALSPASDPGFP